MNTFRDGEKIGIVTLRAASIIAFSHRWLSKRPAFLRYLRPVAVLSLIAVCAYVAGSNAAGAEPTEPAAQHLEPVFFPHVKIGGFWKDQIRRQTNLWIPHCIRQMEAGGAGQELLNLINTAKVKRGEPAGKFTGLPWSDAYVYNTIEAICLALAIDPEDDRELAESQKFLRGKLDEWIPIVLAAQSDDGYIHSYHALNPIERYSNIGHHEFYVQGYFIEAGVAHYLATQGQDRRLFDAARKCADQLCETFGPPPRKTWVHGHPGMEIALCRLARLVNRVEGAGRGDKYVELVRFLYDTRATVPQQRNAYMQSHLPAIEQTEAVGHAVRGTYFYAGIADIALLQGDRDFRNAADKLWESAIHRKHYLTGGVGASHQGEAFAADFDLRNDGYCESCAGCGMSFWADRMNRLHRDAHYLDVQERLLYNNVLGAVELSGQKFYYQNPLASEAPRHAWHACPCCVGNIPRTLIAIKDQMVARNPEKDALFVQHYVASDAVIDDVAGGALRLQQQTDYPWHGDVSIRLEPERPATFTLHLRIPDRGESRLYTHVPDLTGKCTVRVNGEPQAVEVDRGYASLRRTWSPGDRVDLALPMEIQRVYADERVEANRGRVALQRGPLVYNIEDVDHQDQSRSVILRPDTLLDADWRPDLLGGVMVIQDADRRLLAIPNYARLHRGGWSLVWIAEREDVADRRIEPTIASTSKVTTSFQTSEGRFSTRAIHDQREPKQSDERGTPLFHWWPRLGTREWVQYDFAEPARVGAIEVYWYDDRISGGGCRVPDSWQLLYRDGEQWKPVEASLPYGTERDRFNRVTFAPVTTGALRLEVQSQQRFASGILEWRVETAAESE